MAQKLYCVCACIPFSPHGSYGSLLLSWSFKKTLFSCKECSELTASSWELLQLLAKVTLFSGGPQTITEQGRSTGPDHFHTVNIPLTAVSALELSMELAGTL